MLAPLIGAERQYRQRSAGLRTNVLVVVGAAPFVSLGFRISGAAGAAQIAAYVVSGIGFLGAGAIMKEGSKVWGLNAAATLWCSWRSTEARCLWTEFPHNRPAVRNC
ncbi:putative membrane protein YhiD involved in acid resistance [Rhodoblastus acidophilus]|nr:putative membrane protein YhiD involved in acid resistance [Rhodoblastus acidophilus]MCW2335386.1 putative membrane protein YhiD involved in acid resistance [Rhodoblastus acidophilus]